MSKILIVDDEYSFVRTLEAILQAEGYDTASATNGRDALEQIKTAAPDLLVLDIMMPVKSGTEVLAALRASPATVELPVIVTSGMLQPRDLVEDRQTAFLQKPFRVDALLRLVTRVLAAR